MRMLLGAVLTAALTIGAAGTATAAQVGINFQGNLGSPGGDISATPAGQPGSTTLWSNHAASVAGGPEAANGLTVSWTSANAGWRTNVGNNNNLTNGYLDTSDAAAALVTVSNLNAVFTNAGQTRDIYVYFGSDGAGRIGNVYLNPTFGGGGQTGTDVTSSGGAFEFSAQVGDAGFTQTTDSAIDGTTSAANYAVFNIAAGVDSFSVAVTRPTGGVASTGLHGVEIVEVPEPSAVLTSLLGGLGLFVLRRRRK